MGFWLRIETDFLIVKAPYAYLEVNRGRRCCFMSIVELLDRVRHVLSPAAEARGRPPRQVTRTKDLDDEDRAALMAATVTHLDAKPRRLPR